jgi:hypothetical protein
MSTHEGGCRNGAAGSANVTDPWGPRASPNGPAATGATRLRDKTQTTRPTVIGALFRDLNATGRTHRNDVGAFAASSVRPVASCSGLFGPRLGTVAQGHRPQLRHGTRAVRIHPKIGGRADSLVGVATVAIMPHSA